MHARVPLSNRFALWAFSEGPQLASVFAPGSKSFFILGLMHFSSERHDVKQSLAYLNIHTLLWRDRRLSVQPA